MSGLTWASVGFASVTRRDKVYRLRFRYTSTVASTSQAVVAAAFASVHARNVAEMGRHGRVLMAGVDSTTTTTQTWTVIYLVAPSVVERSTTWNQLVGNLAVVLGPLAGTATMQCVSIASSYVTDGGRSRAWNDTSGVRRLDYDALSDLVAPTIRERASSALGGAGSSLSDIGSSIGSSIGDAASGVSDAASSAADEAALFGKRIRITLIIIGAWAVAEIVTDGNPKRLVSDFKKLLKKGKK